MVATSDSKSDDQVPTGAIDRSLWVRVLLPALIGAMVIAAAIISHDLGYTTGTLPCDAVCIGALI